MNKYLAFYKGRKIVVSANTSFEAQKEAAIQFKLKEKDRYKVTVMIAEKADGTQVVHSTSSI